MTPDNGRPWEGIGGKKAKTLPGCDPLWPIGAVAIEKRPLIVLCEGGPDFLAALLAAWWEEIDATQVAPVCMTGAGNSIHADALPFFAGKYVRIAVHADAIGREGGERWARQLYNAGAATVDGFDFEGLSKRDASAVEDLADFATLFDIENLPPARVFEGLNSP